ncbi:hypothetical protein Trydic_g17477 [Trypoxylus dichotomus]
MLGLVAIYGVFLTASGLHALPAKSTVKSQHPDVGLTVIEMIERQGYVVEQHTNIQTSDGYLLDLHRMPYGKNNSRVVGKPVVFLMHGILSSSADWVNMGPEKSIAYQLVEAGYDVWMGNARGNTWSRKHIIYNPNRDSKFWDFSWQEIGSIDVPTMIDYVLKETGQSKLFYIGHSQGTTSFFVMTSEKPEYNDKIRLMVALAPIAYMSHLQNPFLQLVSNFQTVVGWVLDFLGIDEFLPSTTLMELIGQATCNDESLFQGVCSSIYFLIGGWNSAELNETMIPVILTNAPAGSSTKQLLHYAQEMRSAKFRKYDHGMLNLFHYGSLIPPDYDLSKVTAPVALAYSQNDWLSSVVDVHQLASELPNVVEYHLVSDKRFNHLDYLFAIDCKELLYNRLLSWLEKH